MARDNDNDCANSLGSRRRKRFLIQSFAVKFSNGLLGTVLWVVLASVFLGQCSLSHDETDPLGLTFNYQVPIEPISPVCEKLVEDFKETSTNYTRCIIENARSYRRCQSCIDEVIQVFKAYRVLTLKQNGSILCTESYRGMGEVSVFKNVHSFVAHSWEKGGCQNCFSMYTINASASNELSNTTKTFQWLSLQFYKCLFNDSYSNNYVVGSRDFLRRFHELISNQTICVRCKNEYDNLNKFYIAKFETMYDKDDIICVDISDSMNFTRYVWQDVYGCHIEHVSVWPIILTSVILCCVPVAFYLASKIFGREITPNVVPSKRFRGSLVGRVSTASDIRDPLVT